LIFSLAIEFGLFGVKPGELSGSSLLRHGCSKGFVELTFESEGKNVTIRRTLKKAKDTVAQGPGSLTINGITDDLMPKEIRAKVLELLNYPKSLVAKGQDLIYRFTVYTPQEHMRRIIYEHKETRLETLRKVFNIDKYKRTRENTLIYTKFLRTQRSNFEGRIVDLDDKKNQYNILQNQFVVLQDKEKEAEKVFLDLKEKTQKEKIALQKLEIMGRELTESKKNYALLETELSNFLSQHESKKIEISTLEKNIEKLKEELKEFIDTNVDKAIEDNEFEIKEQENILFSFKVEKSKITGKVSNLREDADKIKDLLECPLCKQNVPHEHKTSIANKANTLLQELKSNFEEIEKKEMKQEAHVLALKGKYQALQKKLSEIKAMKVKKDHFVENERRLSLLQNSVKEIKENIGAISHKFKKN